MLGQQDIVPKHPNIRRGIPLQHVQISYPTHGDPSTPTKTTVEEIWNSLRDPSFDGNIVKKFSTKETGLLTCPIMPQFKCFKQTVGNWEIAEERAKPRNEYYKWLQENRPHLMENKLFSVLLMKLSDEVGTMFQGFNPRTYLQCIAETLPTYRSIDYALSKEWRELLERKGFDEHKLVNSKEYNDVVTNTKTFLRSCRGNLEKLKELAAAAASKKKIRYIRKVAYLISDYILKKHVESGKSKPSLTGTITDRQLKDAFLIAYMQTHGKEKDFVIFLPERRLILQIEVKDTTSKKKLHDSKQEAEDQLLDLKIWIDKAHSDIFSDWHYIGVIAFTSIDRNVLDPTNPFLSPSEEPYVLFKDDLADELNSWWENIAEKNPRQESRFTYESAYESYVEYVKRTIGLSKFGCDIRMSSKECSREVRDQLLGIESNPVLSGARDTDSWSRAAVGINSRLRDPKVVPEDERIFCATILWLEKQKELLDNDPLKMITCSDFGTGKTLLLKTKAKQEALDSTKKVYFISLASVDYLNPPHHKVRAKPTVFDVATELQFKNTAVEFVSDLKLQKMYKEERETQYEDNALDMMVWFIKENAGASFFIDELGWVARELEICARVMSGFGYSRQDSYLLKRALQEDDTRRLMDLFTKVSGRLWISLRMIGKSTETNYDILKEQLHQLQVTCSQLQVPCRLVLFEMPVVMRSPGSITTYAGNTTANNISNFVGKFIPLPRPDSLSTLGKPINTVPGMRPKCGFLMSININGFSQVIRKVIKDSEEESFVIIVPRHAEYIRILQDSLDHLSLDHFTYISDTQDSDVAKLVKYLTKQTEQRSILITDIDTFSGMEAGVVLQFSEDFYGELPHLFTWRNKLQHPFRDAVLRSTFQLYVISVRDCIWYYRDALNGCEDLGEFPRQSREFAMVRILLNLCFGFFKYPMVKLLKAWPKQHQKRKPLRFIVITLIYFLSQVIYCFFLHSLCKWALSDTFAILAVLVYIGWSGFLYYADYHSLIFRGM